MAEASETIRKLRARVRQLEAILICSKCGHLRSEHEDNDAPCFGGRDPGQPPGGDYCMCAGFKTNEAS